MKETLSIIWYLYVFIMFFVNIGSAFTSVSSFVVYLMVYLVLLTIPLILIGANNG